MNQTGQEKEWIKINLFSRKDSFGDPRSYEIVGKLFWINPAEIIFEKNAFETEVYQKQVKIFYKVEKLM